MSNAPGDVRHSPVLTVEEATAVERPGTYIPEFGLWENSGPWTWADPVLSIVSDSWKWRRWGESDPQWGPYEHRVAQSAIENLYRCGYALVKVLPEDGQS
jgi:hypothetical protein